MHWVFACIKRLARRAWGWLRSHASLIYLILSVLFVLVVVVTVIYLIVVACRFPLTSGYTLAARYSYILRAIATVIAFIVTFLISKRGWVKLVITIAIESYLASLILDLMNMVTK